MGDRVQDVFGYGSSHTDTADHGRTLFHSEVDIAGVREGLTYAQFNLRRIANATEGFERFGCVKTYGSHEDGYRWAAKHGISKASECNGLSWSEVEGCVAFVDRKDDAQLLR